MLRLYLFYALSGLISLGYQVMWFRIYVDKFGSTNLTFVLVLCNFIGGLGAGALASRRVTEFAQRSLRLSNPHRIYGAVEIGVALSALLTLVFLVIPDDLFGHFPYVLEQGIHYQSLGYQLFKVGIATLCVFVPCFFMGVTYPLLCHAHSRNARFPAALYAWNTLGACSGVLLCYFLLLPSIGHDRSLLLMIGLNGLLGAVFVAFGHRLVPGEEPGEAARVEGESTRATSADLAVLFGCAILSGLLAGSLEADMFKRIWFLGSANASIMSFISFWAILGIFLASWTVRAWSGLRLTFIKVAFVLAMVCYYLTFRLAYPLQRWFLARDQAAVTQTADLPYGAHFVFPGSLVDLLLYTGIFVLPAFYLVSLLLPYVCNRIQAERRHLGLAYGANTVAFCLGMVGFMWIAPRVNAFYSMKLFFVLFGCVLLVLIMMRPGRPWVAWPSLAAAVLFVIGCVVVPASFDVNYVNPATVAAEYPVKGVKSNGADTIYIVEDPAGDWLFFNSFPMSGTKISARIYMRLMAHYPLLLQDNPTDVLLICLGVGNTAGAIAEHDSVERIDIVDLNHQIIKAAPYFAETNNEIHTDPRVRFVNDDGRNFLNVTDRKYNLITSEPPPPLHPGVDRLYSVDYYESVRERLVPGGMMSQWVPLNQLPAEAAEMVIRSFVRVFPHSILITSYQLELNLIGSTEPLDLARLDQAFWRDESVTVDLVDLRVRSPLSLYARILAGPEELRRRFGEGPVIRDDRNSLAPFTVTPLNVARLEYDPFDVLEELKPLGLREFDELGRVLTHYGRLQFHVEDFPVWSLMTRPDDRIRLSELDWVALRGLMSRYVEAVAAGDRAAAEQWLEQMLSVSPEQPRILVEVAEALFDARRYEEALRTIERIRVYEPASSLLDFMLGKLKLRLGQIEQGRELLQSAKRRGFNPEVTNYYLASSHQAEGETAAALELYSAVVDANPVNAFALVEIGTILRERGEEEKAMAYFNRAMAISPALTRSRLGTRD